MPPQVLGLLRPWWKNCSTLDIAVLTSGNHIWDKKEIYSYFRDQVNGRLLRPANYPGDLPAVAFS